ncbi:MAG: AI-2E family transporter [Planctomycetia bacterium]|nr:AI-2E family transporter [Planctomycetia bacterium]
MDRRNMYLALLLFAATILTVWALGLLLWPFIVPIAWAMCLATVTGGTYRRLASRLGRPRLAATVVTLGVAVFVVAPLVVVGAAVAQQAVALSRAVETGRKPAAPAPAPATPATPGAPSAAPAAPAADRWETFFAEHPSLDEIRVKVDRQLASFDTNLRGVADAATAELGQPFARGAVGFVYGFATILFGFLIMLATLFVLLRDGDAIRQIVVDMLPMPEADTKDILETLRSTAYAAIVGGLATSAIQGTLGGLAFWVTGVSSPVLWGFVMGVLSLLPVGGSAFVWAPVAAYFLATGSPVQGWFLVVFGLVVIGSSDNLLRPWLIRKAGAAGVHPLLLFFGVFSGIGLFGASGIVFGPLLAAFVLSVIRIYRQHFGRTAAARKAARGAGPDGGATAAPRP